MLWVQNASCCIKKIQILSELRLKIDYSTFSNYSVSHMAAIRKTQPVHLFIL